MSSKLGYWVVITTHILPEDPSQEIEQKISTTIENRVSALFDDGFRDPNVTSIKIFKPRRGVANG